VLCCKFYGLQARGAISEFPWDGQGFRKKNSPTPPIFSPDLAHYFFIFFLYIFFSIFHEKLKKNGKLAAADIIL